MNRPCIKCGVLIATGSRCDDCRLRHRTTPRGTKGRTATDRRWRNLSQKLRRASPFCELPGCTSVDLTVDHIIPLSERTYLAYDEANLRVICRRHNAAKGNRCTDIERDHVLAAIAARTARRRRAVA